MSSSGHRATSSRRGIAAAIAAVAVAVALLALAWVVVLEIGRTEGDTPSASSLRLPEGASVVAEDRQCGSGGCWLVLEVRPPSGVTPDALATSLDLTPCGSIPGTLVDYRGISLHAEPGVATLEVTLSYWQEWC